LNLFAAAAVLTGGMQNAAVILREDRDAELLAAVAQGNGRAFEQLYLSYHQRLLRFLMRMAPRHDIAEEVINDTFWIVWLRAKDFRGASRVSTWIMGIAQRRALKTLRRARTREPVPPAETQAYEIRLAEPHEETERRDWIRQGLQQLTAEQRASVELAYYLGHSCREIATIMGCGVPAAKARIYQARQRLRASLPALAGDNQQARRASRGLMTVAALVSIGLSGLILSTWSDRQPVEASAPYRTVTESTPEIKGAVIHVVFAPDLDAREREEILQEAGLKIVGGPTPAGLYSLALRDGVESVRSSLERLRRNPPVRFAAPTIGIGDE
jgi:RNA polymerase sigma-70 factor (ECF subfamily)